MNLKRKIKDLKNKFPGVFPIFPTFQDFFQEYNTVPGVSRSAGHPERPAEVIYTHNHIKIYTCNRLSSTVDLLCIFS